LLWLKNDRLPFSVALKFDFEFHQSGWIGLGL
jgi:hypothetical protein